MTEMDNFSEINENFDTIKTLLNSIRAQGILNTSDVDKLLTGINSKLEKINTEEDIDLIKIFLSELKQNLDERHGVLVSKFAAIESLFSNLLKNSTEMPKSSDIKELFDIVATNLSVFSREVVAQKESITEIALRLDAFRSDDTTKKDIIKNITLLKPDLERLNNGFDSIVLSLNDNFKTIVKTISSFDKTESFESFGSALNNLEMSSNTILSALQMLDKKTEAVDDSLKTLATKDEITTSNQRLFELTAQSHELTAAVNVLSDKYIRIDNLADKIDASVNIIANLKALLEASSDKNAEMLLEQLRGIELKVDEVNSESKYLEFKASLEAYLRNLLHEINNGILMSLENKDDGLRKHIEDNIQKLITLEDANVTRVLNDISSSADILGSKLVQAQTAIAALCEGNFSSIFERINNLKETMSQLDDNSVSANNAIFSSINDRLQIFESDLKGSLDAQEKTVNHSSAQLIEQVENIKNISNLLDYKMDSSVVEFNNIKNEFSSLKKSINDVLALDFVNAVKDLRVDLYASKQQLENTFETTTGDLSEKILTDLYSKYESLIAKLESVEDEFKSTQASTLADLKIILDKLSNGIIDILSYVSEERNLDIEIINSKISELTEHLKGSNLSYIETVRDVVDVIRVQVENNLNEIDGKYIANFDEIKKSISTNSDDLKKEIKFSYSKLLQIQDSYEELKQILNINNSNSLDKIDNAIASADSIRDDLEQRISDIKDSLFNKITEFKQNMTLDNANNTASLQSTVENLCNTKSSEVVALLDNLKSLIRDFSATNKTGRDEALSQIFENFNTLKCFISEFGNEKAEEFTLKIDEILAGFDGVKEFIHQKNDESSKDLSSKVNAILKDFASVKSILNRVDENIDGDMTRQLSIIESNFESLVSQMSILFDKADRTLVDSINEEFSNVSERIQALVVQKLDDYKVSIDNTFDNLKTKSDEQSKYIEEKILNLNFVLKSAFEEQVDGNTKLLEELAEDLKTALDENVKLTAVDYVALKNKLVEFAKNIETNNQTLSESLKIKMDEMSKYAESVLEHSSQEVLDKQESLSSLVTSSMATLNDENEVIKNSITELKGQNEGIKDSLSNLSDKNIELKTAIDEQLGYVRSSSADLSALTQICSNNNNLVEELSIKSKEQRDLILNKILASNDDLLSRLNEELSEKFSEITTLTTELSTTELQSFESYLDKVMEISEQQKLCINASKDLLVDFAKNELNLLSKNIEKETDVIIAEIVEQFDLLKKSQADDIITYTTRVEDIISSHIYNNIEDLKSYLDIKTDNSVMTSKLDNLKVEMSSSIEEIISNLNKLLDSSLFTKTLSDYRVANELLVNTSVDRINSHIESIVEAQGKELNENLLIFDKKFVDTLVDKFEEVKMISNKYNDSFVAIEDSFVNIRNDFDNVKSYLNQKIESLVKSIEASAENTNNEVRILTETFESLRSQISNRSFDEAFQASINKQIGSLESLINEQLSYIEDINSLCANSLPDVTELNTLVKHSILESVQQFSEKLDSQNIEQRLNDFKSDIITQFLSLFNQISFVAEQEEILDFIQEKHDELITVLSHIVTSTNGVNAMRSELSGVDGKISSLKGDIEQLNEKISAVIAADGNVDYIYSLQDLEADIANLRLVLNEMKENSHGADFSSLVNSTNDIYNLVESIKTELPSKTDVEGIAEDLVSISSRTNKLLLASDESYKVLQENLQDFKLVINDLDERTRNFAQESGMDKIDSKLNAINNLMVSGAKSNQVFNQVFEYLAEWVDNASKQINDISDRVETLDDITQIKAMLSDLKAEAADNSESVELIEALGAVFDKQTKRITSLETKLDKIIVETTINNKNKIDLTPMEETLNRFLVAMDEKMSSQQTKIESLETKLENVMNLIDEKDTSLLTKKVGGMDRQMSKLNKSIEKIASYVVEK